MLKYGRVSSLPYLWTYFKPCSKVSVVNFEKVSTGSEFIYGISKMVSISIYLKFPFISYKYSDKEMKIIFFYILPKHFLELVLLSICAYWNKYLMYDTNIYFSLTY